MNTIEFLLRSYKIFNYAMFKNKTACTCITQHGLLVFSKIICLKPSIQIK